MSRPQARVFELDSMAVEEVRKGFTRTAVRAAGTLTTMNWFEPGYRTAGQHSHAFDQVSLVLTGTLRFFLGDETRDIAAPAAVYIPGDLPHAAEPVGEERVLNIDVFGPPRPDYLHLCANRDDFDE